MISKQINERYLKADESRSARLRAWLGDRNPVPLRWQFWLDRQDWLHPRRILRKLGNVARWAPILWDDVDWDHSSLFAMLEAKLRFMRECHEADRIHVGWEATAAQIRAAEGCAGRLRRDEYCMQAWSDHYDKYPMDTKFTRLPDGNTILPPMSDESRAAFLAIADEEERTRKADLDRLASTIAENVFGWWN